jgi:hypothetical protein
MLNHATIGVAPPWNSFSSSHRHQGQRDGAAHCAQAVEQAVDPQGDFFAELRPGHRLCAAP